MPFHDVVQGETLIGLAAANGLKDHGAIVDDPNNAELKKMRTDPGILNAGDRVFIPNCELLQHPSAVDASHKFKFTRPKAWLRLAVKDAYGKALANKKYELTIEVSSFTGNTDASGIIEQPAPVDGTTGSLKIYVDDATVEEWTLMIGHMDPIDTDSGIASRLANLGFDTIAAFQEIAGLEVTGTADDALRRKLAAFYDPAQDESAS
jgi:hypothetical protein